MSDTKKISAVALLVALCLSAAPQPARATNDWACSYTDPKVPDEPAEIVFLSVKDETLEPDTLTQGLWNASSFKILRNDDAILVAVFVHPEVEASEERFVGTDTILIDKQTGVGEIARVYMFLDVLVKTGKCIQR